ncbi:unnamed protein product [Ilex paraguariensis]|uniref:Uncharacterized protein n=1 Tax=Ilex paraguariensis TaxID=185542 RepID=A0ABC8RK62_9AQUA
MSFIIDYIHSAPTLFSNAVYKKHHPPMLEDDVCGVLRRLEKMLSIVNPSTLRRILGRGMSEKMWEVTLKHARTCVLGRKLFISRGPNYTVVLNPICQVVTAMIEGQIFSNDSDLTSIHKIYLNVQAYIESLIREAYANWNSLEKVYGLLNETALLTQGTLSLSCDLVDQYPNQPQSTVARLYQQHAFLTDGSIEGASVHDNGQRECSDQWVTNCANLFTPFEKGRPLTKMLSLGTNVILLLLKLVALLPFFCRVSYKHLQ